MKVLILSASIGSGHMQAAEAIAEEFSDSVIVDFMDKNISTMNWLFKKIYLSALKLIPDLYDRIYRIAGVRKFGSITRLIWSTLMYLPFTKILNEYKPNVIICTHPFPEAAASLWKFLHPKRENLFKLVAVLTDYSLHEIWIYNGVDLYFVATEDMKVELETHGNYKVYATGIPIRQQFHQSKKSFDTNSVLIMGGGLGLGAFEDTIQALESIDFQIKIVVVTGNNQNLKSKLQSIKSKHQLEVLGFVENVAELMSNSEILISKPGALTLTESFAVGLPIILLPPIPGPESLNAKYAVDNGVAISINNASEISNVIQILNDKSKLKLMSESAQKLSKIDATKKIFKIITNHQSTMI